ncbi:hypothetical protein LOZ80_03015 [Paenibacillus sp. HWE-109]|uniref:hypothetical protein n=1 Tax=Paenibacillus sp. HWE-109 TaxID=1306526 RepID=UPI001EE0D91D|nr:hypothetical protein [Paenibacillus sp. HWE-109]UKS27937.1 hypothetical protein LOZ80_03015 [Paenibacillus sp. HWE-109]
MDKRQFWKLLLFGFLTWLIPLIFSFFFYNKEGQLSIDFTFFKTLLIVFGALVGSPLLAIYFIKVKSNYIRHGIWLGVIWFVMNITLDALVLLPWLKISFLNYMGQIGLRYLSMPIMSLAVSSLLHKRDYR